MGGESPPAWSMEVVFLRILLDLGSRQKRCLKLEIVWKYGSGVNDIAA